jgi:hypothetical protein
MLARAKHTALRLRGCLSSEHVPAGMTRCLRCLSKSPFSPWSCAGERCWQCRQTASDGQLVRGERIMAVTARGYRVEQPRWAGADHEWAYPLHSPAADHRRTGVAVHHHHCLPDARAHARRFCRLPRATGRPRALWTGGFAALTPDLRAGPTSANPVREVAHQSAARQPRHLLLHGPARRACSGACPQLWS